MKGIRGTGRGKLGPGVPQTSPHSPCVFAFPDTFLSLFVVIHPNRGFLYILSLSHAGVVFGTVYTTSKSRRLPGFYRSPDTPGKCTRPAPGEGHTGFHLPRSTSLTASVGRFRVHANFKGLPMLTQRASTSSASLAIATLSQALPSAPRFGN